MFFDVSFDETTNSWMFGAPDDTSESGFSYGHGDTLTGAFDDLVKFLGYDPRYPNSSAPHVATYDGIYCGAHGVTHHK